MHNNRKLNLIGAATNLGISQLRSTNSHGSEYAPYALEKDLNLKFTNIIDASKEVNISIQNYLKLLFDAIVSSYSSLSLATVIGGDHSIGAATWQAMMNIHGDDISLVWIDAHLDANNFATTPSGNTHGMPLATLLGYCKELEFVEPFHCIKPHNLYLIGTRDYEKEELDLLNKLGVKIYFMDEVRRRSFKVVMNEVQSKISESGKKFGISLDLDYFDPSDIKAVNTSVSGGGHVEDVVEYFQNDLKKANLIAFELVEFNPSKDEGGVTLGSIKKLLDALV